MRKVIYGLVRELEAEIDTVRPRSGRNQRQQPGNKGRKQDFFFSKIQNKADQEFGRKRDHHFILSVEKVPSAQN